MRQKDGVGNPLAYMTIQGFSFRNQEISLTSLLTQN